MLARRTTLQHPLGSGIEMPRLVPSFSSKGFPLLEGKATGVKISEVNDALEMTGPTISDSILVSAYDIFHRYLRHPERFYANKELVIIDSGGYELSLEFDSSEPNQGTYEPDRRYNLEYYQRVLSELPAGYPIMITNFDHESLGKAIEEQIQEAQMLFNKFPQYLHDFIIRPSGRRQYIDLDDAIRHVDKMRRFQVVGITEKELGSNLLECLTNIANLRSAMNRKGVDAPIHIWGGLDPIISPLYFCAGAEIFDGVSWLRYGYYNDVAISRDAYTTIEFGVQTQWRRAQAMRLAKNISYLETLTIRMRRFVDRGARDFSVFETHADVLERAYQALCTKVPELKGGA
jgi:hypothetical protein